MADHFAVMAGRLLTESSLQSAIGEASAVPSTTSAPCDVSVQDGRPASGVLVECRICQEDDDEACMEAPCSCKGSLKYAHRKCIQRWCDEKGDTICEICLQQFVPNYTASSKLFQRGRSTIFFRFGVQSLSLGNRMDCISKIKTLGLFLFRNISKLISTGKKLKIASAMTSIQFKVSGAVTMRKLII
ncbi:uncharacterized protein [Miscanthus floridulus]|uniref:uncharacterized protein n=1 Tax=Miscanthus floridulus TaxID=154761 RepID=UPI00345A8C95